MLRILVIAVLAAAALGAAACGDDDDGATSVPTASPSATGNETPEPTAFPDVCLPNPDPATADFQVLDQPAPESEVTSPLTVSGQVNYFEGTYQIAIYDEDGTALEQTFGTAQQPDVGQLGPFSHRVMFDVTEPTPACLWVYEQSARDGSPVRVGQVPLVLLP